MSRQSNPGKLPAVAVRNAKSKDKPYKLSDGGGMYLLVNPNGSRYWRWKYRINQKEKVLALGVYPSVSIGDAREKAKQAKKLLDKGVDPNTYKRHLNAERKHDSFEPIAEEWFQKESGHWKQGHAENVWRTLEVYALPHLGGMPIKDIRTSDVLRVVKKVEERGALDVAGRVKQRISSIFRYAMQVGYAEFNPADALRDVIQTRKVQHRKSVKQEDLPRFLRELDDYSGYGVTQFGLKLIVHTFVRPGELRFAEWSEFDLENAIWRIPAEKTKMKEEHLVPLSKQAIAILAAVESISGSCSYVFPGSYDYSKPMSENTLTCAIKKRLHFDATAHGFRTTASTILNEAGYRVDVIERQLAHAERNKVRAAYNRSQYLAERTEMMQWYSDYLDGIKTGADVVPIHNQA